MKGTIPILQLDGHLLVSIQVDLHDRLALAFMDELGEAVQRTSAIGVILDVSSLRIIDSFIGRVLADIARSVALQGARAVIVGIRPEVALTLVELGVELPGVLTARTVAMAVERLAELERPE